MKLRAEIAWTKAMLTCVPLAYLDGWLSGTAFCLAAIVGLWIIDRKGGL